jgi:ABC-type multidrug transport system, ATPase component
MKAINCSSMSKAYHKKTALNNIGFSIDENKIVGIVGRNGAGKTTLLKICAGYLIPTTGEVKVYGEVCFNNLNILSDLVFVSEDNQYDNSMKLSDILRSGKAFYENFDDAVALDLLSIFNLNEKLKYGHLSTGMKTQFNIIMGLSTRSKLTIFDEPTLGLDVAVRKQFYDILLKEYMEYPRTIIIASHLLNEIENLLEEVIILNKGEVLLHKPIDEMQKYAVYLTGKKDVVLEFIKNKHTIFMEDLGNTVKAAIENDLVEKENLLLSAKGVVINKVPTEDVFVYLTNKNERGEFIDSQSEK